MKPAAPERLWLQVEGDCFGDWEGVTWCIDKINDTDVEYVKASALEETQTEAKKQRAKLEEMFVMMEGGSLSEAFTVLYIMLDKEN